jgi:hypothetical protein
MNLDNQAEENIVARVGMTRASGGLPECTRYDGTFSNATI